MSKKKWGESFLKSGLPLEHLTIVTFRSLDWNCRPRVEYIRENLNGEKTWFEIDLEASSYETNKDTSLSFLVECKYHDLSRFWFFLPHDSERWAFNDRVLNVGPFQLLADPRSKSLLSLAPCSAGGIVISAEGDKQENAVSTAIQQIVNGFVPCSLNQFSYDLDFHNSTLDIKDFLPSATAVVPMIVTNACIYRLKPEVTDLELIRNASSPNDIADEVEWTWCYHDPLMALINQNVDALEMHKMKEAELFYRFPYVEQRLEGFDGRPNWIAIVNIKFLKNTIKKIADHFQSIQTISVNNILKGRDKRRRKHFTKTNNA